MAITVTSCKYFPTDFTTIGGTDRGSDHLLGSVGSNFTAVIDFYVKVSAESISIINNATDGTLTRTDSGSFITDGFQVGNSVTTTGMGVDNGNHIISFVTDKIITVSTTLTTTTTNFSASLYRTNLLTAAEFYYNLVENSAPDSFVSLVDSETQQRYTASGFTATGTTATFAIASNSKAWAVDGNGYGVTLLGTGISNYKQSFRITQVGVITPVALYSQLDQLEDGIPPASDYYQDRKCLRHLFKINMKIDRTDPEQADTITYSRKGNTGWYGEYLNGEPATYSATLNSYTYSAASVTSIQYDDTTATTANITLTSSLGTFATGTTAVLHVCYIPQAETIYTNTTRKFRDVFAYDRVALTCGSGAAAGINLGTTYAQINTATATWVNVTTITITADFKMATALETIISGNSTDDRNYLIFVTVQDKTITQTKLTDMNSVIVDVNSYGKDLDDSTLFTINPNVKYYSASGSLIGSSVSGYGGDIVRAVAPFQVKNSGSQLITSIGVRTDAVYTGTTGTFTLEEWTADTSDVCLDDGVQVIDISQSKGYRMNSNSVLNKVTVSRTASLDTATKAGYTLSYPFMLRYETWRTLPDADCDFGEATQDWSVITSRGNGWSIKQYITASVYDPATLHTTDFEQSCDIAVTSTGATGSTGAWCVITTYDNAGTYSQGGDILEHENTTVIANFYGSFTSPPAGTTGYYGMLFLDQQTIGGVNWVYPFSSVSDIREANGTSPWMGATGSTGTCSVTLVSSTHIQVKAKLDYIKLSPSINNYNLRAKLDYLV